MSMRREEPRLDGWMRALYERGGRSVGRVSLDHNTTLSQDMLACAAQAASDPSTPVDQIRSFLASCRCEDGGFRGKAAGSDLYYTAFALDVAPAVGEPLDTGVLLPFLKRFESGAGLNLIHLACLIRCWSRMPPDTFDAGLRERLAQGLAAWRGEDGLFRTAADAKRGSVAGCFIACAAQEDLGLQFAEASPMFDAIERLRTPDGGYANEPGMPSGTVQATAAALVLQERLGIPPEERAAEWILNQLDSSGGFRAAPIAPVPDLLSTAIALYALHFAGFDLAGLRDTCGGFVAGAQRSNGGYAGHQFDAVADCEYTFYALVALGCLKA